MTTETELLGGLLAARNDSKSEWLEVPPGGHRFIIRVSSDDTHGAYSVLEVVADYPESTPMHVHENEDECFIILEGHAQIANGDTKADLAPGAVLTVRRGVRHAWRSLSEAPLRMLVLFTPGGIDKMFREVAMGGNIDLAALGEQFGTRIVGPLLSDAE